MIPTGLFSMMCYERYIYLLNDKAISIGFFLIKDKIYKFSLQ